jgi:hypothetical protein
VGARSSTGEERSTTAGVQLQQWTATGGTNQQWYLIPA